MLKALYFSCLLVNFTQLLAQSCETNLEDKALKSYLKDNYWNTWEMVNSETGINMFGCKPIPPHEYEPYRTPINCFKKEIDKKPAYPLVNDRDYSRFWPVSDVVQNMRIIKVLKWDEEPTISNLLTGCTVLPMVAMLVAP